MELIEILVLSVMGLGLAPGVFWLWYVYRKDRWEPEPKRLVVKTFLLGAAAAFVAIVVETPFRFLGVAVSLVVAPIVEELVKFAAVRWSIYKDVEFDEPMDGIVYASAAALGFASVENPLYLWDAYRSEDADGLSPLGALLILSAARALLSVPGHVLFSSMWGYALGWSKFTHDPRRARALVQRGLALAIALHALFNLLAVALLPLAGGVVVLSVVMWRMLRHRIHGALSRSPHRTERPS